jgi:hypothetical protein
MGVSREEGRRSRGAIGWMKSIVEWRDGGAADARGRQIHGRAEKVGTSFCLHFVLFSSRDILGVYPEKREKRNAACLCLAHHHPVVSQGWMISGRLGRRRAGVAPWRESRAPPGHLPPPPCRRLSSPPRSRPHLTVGVSAADRGTVPGGSDRFSQISFLPKETRSLSSSRLPRDGTDSWH